MKTVRHKASREVLNRVYSKLRGSGLTLDPSLSYCDLYGFVRRMGLARLRGLSRGYRSVYLGRGVEFRSRRRVSIGRGVSLGDRVLIDALSRNGVTIGDSVTIDGGAVLRASGSVRRLGQGITLDERAAVGYANFIHGGGGVHIGRDCLLGPYVQIFSENHVFADASTPVIEQGEVAGAVVIGPDCWIGSGSIVLAGVTIGQGAVVAAGSVVTRDIAPGVVVAGVPAREISVRGGA